MKPAGAYANENQTDRYQGGAAIFLGGEFRVAKVISMELAGAYANEDQTHRCKGRPTCFLGCIVRRMKEVAAMEGS